MDDLKPIIEEFIKRVLIRSSRASAAELEAATELTKLLASIESPFKQEAQ